MRSAAPMCAATASQLSRHHRSRDADPDAAYAVSSMPAIPATLRAQAADSARDHASTAPAPEVSAAVVAKDSVARDSNIHSNLPTPPDQSQAQQASLWMKSTACGQLAERTEI